MINALENAVKKAILSSGVQEDANKAYLEFMKANFIIPIEKELRNNEPVVLYLQEATETYLPVFSNRQYFDNWAAEIQDHIHVLSLSGVDLLKGIGDGVSVCLNPGSDVDKIFQPAEIARLKNMVLKLFR